MVAGILSTTLKRLLETMNNESVRHIGAKHESGHSRALWILGFLTAAGMATYFYVLSKNPSPHTWGLFSVNYVFLLGITQFGVVFASIMRIVKAKWSKPYFRLAELTTLAFFPFAIIAFLFIYFYGRHDIFYWLDHSSGDHQSPWLNEQFLLWRNIVAQLIFYAFSFWYFINALLPDVHESDTDSGPLWRRIFYQKLLEMKAKRDMSKMPDKLYDMSIIVCVLFFLPNTFIAWDFGMMLYPHFHSTVYPLYFIMGNMFAGAASLILLHNILSRFVAIRDFFGVRQVQNMGVLLTSFALLWLYLHWAQFFVIWFGNLPHEYAPIWKQMYGHYAPLFWTMMLFVVGIPIVALIFQKIKRTQWTMELLTFIMIVGIWINRYLNIMPAISDDHLVFSTFAEAVITVGWFAGFFFVLLILFDHVPVIPMAEIAADADEGKKYATYTFE